MDTTNPNWFLKARLKTRQLLLLIALDDYRNIHRAAEELHMTQPAASKQIKDLEEMLEVRLFERLPRGMEPTIYGETMIRHARMALTSLALAHDDLVALKAGLSGQVEVGVIMSPAMALLPRAIARIKEQAPLLRIGVHLEPSNVLLDKLQRGTLDFMIGRILEKVGQKGQDTCELFFDEAHVPLANVLGGEEGRGFAQLMTELPYERTILGVCGVAAIERALQLTVEHTRERKAFGQALIEMQNTRFVLAEIKTEATVARIFVDRCIEDMLAGRMDTVRASMAKYWISDLQCKVVDQCVQLFGGYGYMLEYPIAQMYVDARVQRIYGGANEIMKEIIARSL